MAYSFQNHIGHLFIQMTMDKICSGTCSPWKKVAVIVMRMLSLEMHLWTRSNLRQLIGWLKWRVHFLMGTWKETALIFGCCLEKIRTLARKFILDGPRTLRKHLLEITFLVDWKQLYIVQNAYRKDTDAEIGLLPLSVQHFPCPPMIINLYVNI